MTTIVYVKRKYPEELYQYVEQNYRCHYTLAETFKGANDKFHGTFGPIKYSYIAYLYNMLRNSNVEKADRERLRAEVTTYIL